MPWKRFTAIVNRFGKKRTGVPEEQNSEVSMETDRIPVLKEKRDDLSVIETEKFTRKQLFLGHLFENYFKEGAKFSREMKENSLAHALERLTKVSPDSNEAIEPRAQLLGAFHQITEGLNGLSQVRMRRREIEVLNNLRRTLSEMNALAGRLEKNADLTKLQEKRAEFFRDLINNFSDIFVVDSADERVKKIAGHVKNLAVLTGNREEIINYPRVKRFLKFKSEGREKTARKKKEPVFPSHEEKEMPFSDALKLTFSEKPGNENQFHERMKYLNRRINAVGSEMELLKSGQFVNLTRSYGMLIHSLKIDNITSSEIESIFNIFERNLATALYVANFSEKQTLNRIKSSLGLSG
ncbi:MAG: hypothetical protein ABIA76_00570 [Candidatus Diapherotrites archaeon]